MKTTNLFTNYSLHYCSPWTYIPAITFISATPIKCFRLSYIEHTNINYETIPEENLLIKECHRKVKSFS